jgi:hypothetical protein
MTKLRLGLIASTVGWWFGLVGCGSSSSSSASDGGQDRSSADRSADAVPTDASACQCQLDNDGGIGGGGLKISWACYAAIHGSETRGNFCGVGGTWTSACGIDVYATGSYGGPEKWAYDPSGALVGVQLSTEPSDFVCPSDPTNTSLQSGLLLSGQFPDATCPTIPCSCSDAGLICPPPDAGSDR